MWTIRLPYTRPPLSLNDRMHWRAKARLTKEIRATVAAQVRLHDSLPTVPKAVVSLVYVPRDGRRRDPDNLVATLKPCLDGLRDARILPDDDAKHVDIRLRIDPPDRTDPHLYLTIESTA